MQRILKNLGDQKGSLRGEAGIVQAAVLLILIAGLLAAIYLVKQTQIFKPKANFIPTAQFIDTNGNVLTETKNPSVRLKITRDNISATGDTASFPTLSPTPTITPTSTTALTPTPSGLPSIDSDSDGDPDLTDCGPNDSRAHHGQTEYFTTAYTNQSGVSSFDFDCSGTAQTQIPDWSHQRAASWENDDGCHTQLEYIPGIERCGASTTYQCNSINTRQAGYGCVDTQHGQQAEWIQTCPPTQRVELPQAVSCH